MNVKMCKINLYAGLTKEDFYFACTPLSQKHTGLNMKNFVCSNFIKGLKSRIWIQNNYNLNTDGNVLPIDIETQTISKYYRKKTVNFTNQDFEQLKEFIILNKNLLLEIWEQNPSYTSDEIIEKIQMKFKNQTNP